MPIHQTARTFGARRVPELNAASGCWQLGEVTQARRDGIWPQASDLFFSDVSLLLQDSLTDQSPQERTLVINGNTSLDATDPKFGTNAISMGAVGDYISMTIDSSLDFSGQFTLECWAKPTPGTDSPTFFCHRRSSSSAADITFLGFNGTDEVFLRLSSYVTPVASALPILDGDWHHVACCRDSTHFRLYFDGVEQTSVAVPASFTVNSIGLPFLIGSMPFYGSRQYIGKMDEIRVTNGVARYPGGTPFTPTTKPFPSK